jgi:hypothetical protein
VSNQNQAVEAHIEKRSAPWHVHVITLGMSCLLCATSPMFGQASASPARETGKVSGVRSVLRVMPLCTPRYPRIHDFDVYFSLRIGQQKYCVDYNTVVLDEIQELTRSEGKDLDISVDVRRNKVILYPPQSRKLKARIVRPDLCKSSFVSYSAFH